MRKGLADLFSSFSSRLDVKDDMRDILMVAGEDPYADFRPIQDLTKPFVRADKAQPGAIFNEVPE